NCADRGRKAAATAGEGGRGNCPGSASAGSGGTSCAAGAGRPASHARLAARVSSGAQPRVYWSATMTALLLRLLVVAGLLGAALAQANPAEQDPAGRWRINMRDADIRVFTEQVASLSGQTL